MWNILGGIFVPNGSRWFLDRCDHPPVSRVFPRISCSVCSHDVHILWTGLVSTCVEFLYMVSEEIIQKHSAVLFHAVEYGVYTLTSQFNRNTSTLKPDIVWSSTAPAHHQIPVLGWRERNPMWSSTVVAHPAQGLKFWHTFLFSTVAKSDYTSYRSLPVNSGLFSSTRRFCSVLFLFFPPFCVNSRNCCGWKIHEIYLAPATTARSE